MQAFIRETVVQPAQTGFLRPFCALCLGGDETDIRRSEGAPVTGTLSLSRQ